MRTNENTAETLCARIARLASEASSYSSAELRIEARDHFEKLKQHLIVIAQRRSRFPRCRRRADRGRV